MHDTLRQGYYCPKMTKEVELLVYNCAECCITGGNDPHQRFLNLFHASKAFEFVAMDVLGQLPKTSTRIHFTILITDRYF